jgi:hypothetical protein
MGEAVTRNYSFEALAEVTGTDWNVGRGELNAALRDIKAQTVIDDDYLLSCEIHARAKMYRAVFEGAALTPTALSKHWTRVFEETKPRKPLPPPEPHPPSNRERNLEEARKILEMLK